MLNDVDPGLVFVLILCGIIGLSLLVLAFLNGGDYFDSVHQIPSFRTMFRPSDQSLFTARQMSMVADLRGSSVFLVAAAASFAILAYLAFDGSLNWRQSVAFSLFVMGVGGVNWGYIRFYRANREMIDRLLGEEVPASTTSSTAPGAMSSGPFTDPVSRNYCWIAIALVVLGLLLLAAG